MIIVFKRQIGIKKNKLSNKYWLTIYMDIKELSIGWNWVQMIITWWVVVRRLLFYGKQMEENWSKKSMSPIPLRQNFYLKIISVLYQLIRGKLFFILSKNHLYCMNYLSVKIRMCQSIVWNLKWPIIKWIFTLFQVIIFLEKLFLLNPMMDWY